MLDILRENLSQVFLEEKEERLAIPKSDIPSTIRPTHWSSYYHRSSGWTLNQDSNILATFIDVRRET
jgi:hypothetical protein